MKTSPARRPSPPPASETNHEPATTRIPTGGAAANDEVPVDRQRTGDDEPLGPLWVITIAMGAFFVIAGLVLMFD